MTLLNDWIQSNQALVISLGIPCLTLLIGFLGSYLVHKAKSDEVRLMGRLKLAEFRKDNFDKLQTELGALHAALSDHISKRLTQSKEDYEISVTEYLTIIQMGEDVMVKIRTNPEHVHEFMSAFGSLLEYIGPKKQNGGEQGIVQFRKIAHEILATEWRQIELELKRLY